MAKAALYLDKRRKAKEGYPIKIRVSSGKARRYYSTGYYVDGQRELDSMFRIDVRGNRKIIRDRLNAAMEKAEDTIKHLDSFDYGLFEKVFLSKSAKSKNVFDWYKDYEARLKEEGRISTSNSYRHSRVTIQDFIKTKKKTSLLFSEITIKWLESYERWMDENDKSQSTIGIYLRNLRRIYNLAIESKVAFKELFPFGKDKFVIPSSVNHKRALTLDQVNQIFHIDCKPMGSTDKWKDFWIFSYVNQGMNFKDIANLKWTNLHSGKLRFLREKTKRSAKDNQKEIVVVLSDVALNIIEKWGKKDSEYIFGFYNKSMTPSKKLSISNQQVKNINKCMSRISDMLEFDFKPTFIYARHSYSTISVKMGMSIEFVSEALGHKTIQTTRTYVDSFEEEKVKDHNNKLIDLGYRSKLSVSHKKDIV